MPGIEPPIDVGIATWGPTEYLSSAVESVLEQGHGNLTLFISHDGPDDAAARASVEPFMSDERVVYSARQERLGAAGNKTWLINQGSAGYVALLDHDDVWERSFLDRRVRFLSAHPECGFAFGSLRQVDSDGAELERITIPLSEGIQGHHEFVKKLLRQNLVGSSAALVRRATYRAVDPRFDQRLPTTYDYEMWVRLAIEAPAALLPGYDVRFRVHAEQSTASLSGLEDEYPLLVEHLAAIVSERLPAVPVGRRFKQRRLASLLLTGALIASERGDPASARRYLGRALRIDPWSAVDPRVPASILGFAFGTRGRAVLAKARAVAHHHGIRMRR